MKWRKWIVSVLAMLWLFLFCGAAEPDGPGDYEAYTSSGSTKDIDKKDLKGWPTKGICPRTGIVGDVLDCMKCHAHNWRLKEVNPHEIFSYPNDKTKIVDEIGYFTITDTIGLLEANQFKESLEYFTRHKISHIVIELYSPGGSMFSGLRLVGLMERWQAIHKSRIIETRCYGYAASAAFIIMTSGTEGYRYVSPVCQLMWHELIEFKMFSIETPSDKEEAARILRHFQDTMNTYLASCTNKMTKEDIDEKVKKKEFWMSGKQAVEIYGFADAFTNS